MNAFLKTNLKITLRTMWRDLSYSATSVLGLTVGVVSFLFVLLWVSDEFKFNRAPAGKNIAFVLANIQQGPGMVDTWVTTPYILGRTLQEKYPAIAKSATVTWERTFYFRRGDDVFDIKGIFATPEFIDLFDLPVSGGPRDLFAKKINAVLVTRSFVARYFGEPWQEADVVGKELITSKGELFEISGILPDVHHSTVTFDVLVPYDYFLRANPSLADWDQYSSKTFVEVRSGYSIESANASILHAVAESGPDPDDDTELLLQPFDKTYLEGKYSNGSSVGGRIDYIRVLALAASMILLLSVINFIVLLTIRTSKRRKEMSVKKVLGATRLAAGAELLSESLLVFAFALVFAFVVAVAGLPAFNMFTGKSVLWSDFVSVPMGYFLGGLFLLSLIAGFLPVYLQKVGAGMSLWRPTKTKFAGGATLRKSMIAAQYTLTLLLVVGSIVISQQSDYFLSKDLGIDRGNVVIAKIGNSLSSHKLQTLKAKLSSLNGVRAVSFTDANPLEVNNEEMGFTWEGMNKYSEKDINFTVLGADPDFLKVLGIELADGRNFYVDPAGDSGNFLINGTAAKAMELEDPKEKKMNDGKIIGIVSDFHFKSLYSPIDPLIIRLERRPTHVIIKLGERPTESLTALIKNEYRQVDPSRPLDLKYLDDEYAISYRSELMVRDLILAFTLISIVVSAIGQLSLITYTTEMKTKEIGIRKVLGASERTILQTLLLEFVLLMCISFAFSIPLSIALANNWLDQFAYHVQVGIGVYLVAVAFIVVMTLVTVLRTATRAARQNPVRSLRYE